MGIRPPRPWTQRERERKREKDTYTYRERGFPGGGSQNSYGWGALNAEGRKGPKRRAGETE